PRAELTRTAVRPSGGQFQRSTGPLPPVHSAQRRESGLRSLQKATDLGENFFSRNELRGSALNLFETALDLRRPGSFDFLVGILNRGEQLFGQTNPLLGRES